MNIVVVREKVFVSSLFLKNIEVVPVTAVTSTAMSFLPLNIQKTPDDIISSCGEILEAPVGLAEKRDRIERLLCHPQIQNMAGYGSIKTVCGLWLSAMQFSSLLKSEELLVMKRAFEDLQKTGISSQSTSISNRIIVLYEKFIRCRTELRDKKVSDEKNVVVANGLLSNWDQFLRPSTQVLGQMCQKRLVSGLKVYTDPKTNKRVADLRIKTLQDGGFKGVIEIARICGDTGEIRSLVRYGKVRCSLKGPIAPTLEAREKEKNLRRIKKLKSHEREKSFEKNLLESVQKLGLPLELYKDFFRLSTIEYVSSREKVVHRVFAEKADGDLEKFLPNRELGLKLLGDVLLQLERLHVARFVHRDIKTKNILVFKDRAILIDMDFCVPFGGDTKNVGTYGFIPPEVIEKKSTSSMPGSDLFAFGMTLVACCFPSDMKAFRTEYSKGLNGQPDFFALLESFRNNSSYAADPIHGLLVCLLSPNRDERGTAKEVREKYMAIMKTIGIYLPRWEEEEAKNVALYTQKN